MMRRLLLAVVVWLAASVGPLCAQTNPGTTNLISWWSSDESSGDLVDAHGSNTLAETSGTIDAATGIVGGARDYEKGDTEYFTLADNASLSVADNDFSIAAWFRLESTGVAHRAITKGNGSNADLLAYQIQVTSANRFRFLVGNGSTSTNIVDSTFGAFSAGTWYFCVAVHDSVANELRISVNASAEQTTACSHGSHDDTSNFFVGELSAGSGQSFDGLIDEIAFFKSAAGGGGALSADNIAWLYNSGNGRSYADLTAGGSTPVRRQAILIGSLDRAQWQPVDVNWRAASLAMIGALSP